jgi:DNA helicase-2/ATP-dependent DNA helicase PcrA
LNDIDPQYVSVDESSNSGTRKRSFAGRSSSWDDDLSALRREPWNATLSTTRSTDSPLGSLNPIPGRSSFVQARSTVTASAQSSVSSVDTAAGTLSVGKHIEHSRFGRGEIIALSGSGIDAKATVKFENVGTKQLLLRFAKFTIL